MTWRLVSFVTASMLAVMLAPAVVRADGDPASDVLLGANVFYPYSPPVTAALQKSLNGETAAASRARFPIKVALIASPADLGAVPSLFGRPQRYADFLEQEITFQAKQRLLVVMASGYGVQGLTPPATAAVAALPKPAGRQSDDLARAAIVAVRKLTAAAGHPINSVADASAAGTGNGNGNGSTSLIVAILALAALATAGALVALRRRPAGGR